MIDPIAMTSLAELSGNVGFGLVTIGGGLRPAVRVQVNPSALASAGLFTYSAAAWMGSTALAPAANWISAMLWNARRNPSQA